MSRTHEEQSWTSHYLPPWPCGQKHNCPPRKVMIIYAAYETEIWIRTKHIHFGSSFGHHNLYGQSSDSFSLPNSYHYLSSIGQRYLRTNQHSFGSISHLYSHFGMHYDSRFTIHGYEEREHPRFSSYWKSFAACLCGLAWRSLSLPLLLQLNCLPRLVLKLA